MVRGLVIDKKRGNILKVRDDKSFKIRGSIILSSFSIEKPFLWNESFKFVVFIPISDGPAQIR